MFDKIKLFKLKYNYIKSKMRADAMRELDKSIRQSILASKTFYYEDEPLERIIEPVESCFMSNEDFDIYLDLVHIEWLKHDRTHKRNETVWKYEEAERKAADKLIDYVIDYVIPSIKNIRPASNLNRENLIKIKGDWKYEKEFVNLILQHI